MPDTLRPFYNPGPGDVIRDAMDELGWQQSDLAEITGLTEKSINKIINNKQGITPETAVLLGEQYGKYLSAERLEQISKKSGVSIPVALGILQHAGIIEWRQFRKYREKVLEQIPQNVVKG